MKHHNKLTGTARETDLQRRNEEALKIQKEKDALNDYMRMNRNRNQSLLNMTHSTTVQYAHCKDIFEFQSENEWHQNMKKALTRCRLKHLLTIDQIRAINYFHTVHQGIMMKSSVPQIVQNLKREQQHDSLIPHHYQSEADIQDAISALADAQREMDMKVIHEHREISVSEDGNKLHGMPGRGYMVKVIHRNELKELFVALKNPMKPVQVEWENMDTIDSGNDTFLAMKQFVEQDLAKLCSDVVSIATDWSGCNSGTVNGASGKV